MNYYTSVIILILLALIVLSILIHENNRIPLEKKRLFFITNLMIALAAVSECAGVHINGNPDVPAWLLMVAKTADYTFTPMTGGALIALMQKSENKKFPLKWLFVGNAVFQIVCAFTDWMTVIDGNNHYTHGPLYPVYMALYFAVIIILIIKMISYGKSFRKQNRISLYATMGLVFAGIAIQEILGSDHRVAYIALTFGAAYLFIHYSEFSQLEMDDEISKQKVIITKDALTGVFSRFAYVDAIKEYGDNIPEDFAVFLMDINGLKATNDSLGHEAGDDLICGAAKCIESTVGKDGKTFRIGGDEFVVFANMRKDQADAALTDLEHSTQNWSWNKSMQLSLSAGYALAKDYAGYSIVDLAKEADKVMYEQKKAYYEQNGVDRRKPSPVSVHLK